jgi:aspartyl-tRNA(Asn)/glutamyl-tRNA(Gln) amidotransferase subunit C
MAKLTLDDVFKLARLANISLTEDEAKELLKDLDVILNYFNQLKELDLSDTEPTYQVTGLSNVERGDSEFDYNISTKELLKNVAETENNYIKVKRVL